MRLVGPSLLIVLEPGLFIRPLAQDSDDGSVRRALRSLVARWARRVRDCSEERQGLAQCRRLMRAFVAPIYI